MQQTKCPVSGGMTVRAYTVLCRAVEDGVAYGCRRAHKHTAAPDVNTIEEQIVTGVLNEISLYFDFTDDVAEP
jgi:hypothetical protein